MSISDRLSIGLAASLTGNRIGDESAVWRFTKPVAHRFTDRPAIDTISSTTDRDGLAPNDLASP